MNREYEKPLILVNAIAGSHLFGTNTPTSDTDYKGIYIPTIKQLFLQEAPGSIPTKRSKAPGEKNTAEDIDVELFSLHKFMTMLWEGQTVALELLWTPDNLIVEAHPAWIPLRDRMRVLLMHKKVTAFVDYCRKQAAKYGVKGSRMAAVKAAITEINRIVLECPVDENFKLITIWESLKDSLSELEHIEFGVQETIHGDIPYMKICERMYQDNQSIEYTLRALESLYQSYGHRAKLAESNEGIDWKALSHAYRVCCQAYEILSEATLTLPLKPEDLSIVRLIKAGQLPFKEVQVLLETKLDQVLVAKYESKLPEEFDYRKWCEDFVADFYCEYSPFDVNVVSKV